MNLYTLWDMIGVIGGIYEVMKVLSGMLVNIFTEKMMSIDLLNSYYQKAGNNHSDNSENKSNVEHDRHNVQDRIK